MPLRLEIKKKLSARSDRVKSVDLHPTEPWVLSALYSGNVFLWNTDTSSLEKSWEGGMHYAQPAIPASGPSEGDIPTTVADTTQQRVVESQRSISWSVGKNHLYVDDMRLRVYNYNTMEKVKDVEAHADYIRYVEVHPTMPYVLSSSDDMSMKLWNWEAHWECVASFEGHAHYVMMCKFNLKDTNTFASASLDRTIKVWGLGASQPHFSLEGHERGVNCLDYYPGGDKPYLLSGADDKTVKIWDYQTKSCIQTLEGHANNVCSVLFHPRLPVLVSASEDGTVRIWHATTYRAETTLNYGLERAWSISAAKQSNGLAIGYDEGTVLIKLGHDAPVASLDTHTGKLVWTNNNDVLSSSLKGVVAEDAQDGDRVAVVSKDMGSCEIFPQTVQHNCNGRFLVVCGDGEYIIYTAQALRNKAFGSALDFVWSNVGTGDYAIRESLSRVKVFRNFKEHAVIKPPIAAAEGLFGGATIAVRGADCVCFFDWGPEGTFLCQIDVAPTAVYWNETQELVLLVCDAQAFVLRFDRDLVDDALRQGTVSAEVGVPGAFEPVHEIADKIVRGQWVGDCFLYSNALGHLAYFVGGSTMTLCHLDDSSLHFLGYLPKENRIFLMDRNGAVVSYKALLAVLQYQTAVVRRDFDAANALLAAIPESDHSSVARFLELQGYKDVALQVTRDPDHKFDLALELKHLATAHDLLKATSSALEDGDDLDAQTKWKRLGDLALQSCDLALFEKCATKARDFAGLLLLYTSQANRAGVSDLADAAKGAGKLNVAFVASFILGDVARCFDLLLEVGRIPDAALLARTYLPSHISKAVKLWREDLKHTSERAAEALADPADYANLFPDLEWALKVEALFTKNRTKKIPADQYLSTVGDLDLDLIALVKDQAQRGVVMQPDDDADAPGDNDEDLFATKQQPASADDLAAAVDDLILNNEDDEQPVQQKEEDDDDDDEPPATSTSATTADDDANDDGDVTASKNEAATAAADDDDDDDLASPAKDSVPPPEASTDADAILNDDFGDDDDDDW